ncbi:hypothetical protein FDP41_000293 [Naegleria fowleri]|uniref:Uncharacterized protein n=1 Tax=Naegleria fowleri TaxID=5763 RepID=A0A6A5CCV3_NAEFO|nr:uncharacterized protein FDP41_000293 [Naegleria fowleri]KAF0984394.1 hypothetical protein FDP41_000293 [Naegleria fowleri]
MQIMEQVQPAAMLYEIDISSLLAAHLAQVPIIETLSTPILEGRHSSYMSYFLNAVVSQSNGVSPPTLYHCYVAHSSIQKPYTLLNYTHFSNWYNGDELSAISELTMSHGGANSVVQSLYFGVPTLVNSGYMFERAFNGYSAQKVGGGLLLDPEEFRHEIIYDKLFAMKPFWSE